MTDTQTGVNGGTWRMLAAIGVILQVVALAFVIWSQKWGGAWTIGVFLVLSVGFLLMQDRLPSIISFLVVLAAMINAGGWAWNWYQVFAWFDEFVHAFTSFAIMSAVGYLAWLRNWSSAVPGTPKFVLWVAAVGLGLGILWEIFESLFLNLTIWDTIVDLVMDTLGAAVAGWFVGQVAPHPQPGTTHHAKT